MQTPPSKSGYSRLRAALVNEDGTATIEAVIWLPAFFAIFALIADTSTIFGSESQVLRIIQDANRNLSTGYTATAADAQSYIVSQIGHVSPNAVVSTQIVGNVITTRVEMPFTDITATGLVDVFLSGSVTVSAGHAMEEQ